MINPRLSFWEYDQYFKNIDVAIIGSGIVGLSTALHIKTQSPLLKVVIVERSFLPYGASTRNAGFACFGSVSELLDDMTNRTSDEVFALVQKRYKGLKLLRKTLGDKNIGYHELGGYELFTHDDNFLFQQCESAIENFNIEFKDITNVESTYTLTDEKISKFGFDGVSHLIWNKCEGQIDTGLMMESLLEKVRNLGVTIFNGIEIEKWEEAENSVMVHCNDGFYFEAKKMIVCNNGFAKTILPQLDVQAARAQVLITNEIANLPFEGCFHYDKGYYYFRNIGKRVLFGGGRNLNFAEEATTEFGLTELIQNRLEEILKNTILPNHKYEIEQRWSGIMGLGNSKSSIVKSLTKRTYCAVRMGGMGIAIGSLIGAEAAEMIIQEM